MNAATTFFSAWDSIPTFGIGHLSYFIGMSYFGPVCLWNSYPQPFHRLP